MSGENWDHGQTKAFGFYDGETPECQGVGIASVASTNPGAHVAVFELVEPIGQAAFYGLATYANGSPAGHVAPLNIRWVDETHVEVSCDFAEGNPPAFFFVFRQMLPEATGPAPVVVT